jgi:tetratricopeptide (TPR) repeat protein
MKNMAKTGTKKISLVLLAIAALTVPAFSAAATNKNIASQAFELRTTGHTEEAIDLLTRTIAEDTGNARSQFELARCYFWTMMHGTESGDLTLKQKQQAMKGKLLSSKKAIQKAIKTDPENARYHFWAGIIGTYNAIYDAHSIWTIPSLPFDSIATFNNYEKAVKLKPDYHQARQNLMGLYDRLPWFCGGNKSKAKKQLEKLEKLDPVYGARARCEIQPYKQPEEMIAIWQKVADAYPENAKAHAGLADAYMSAEKMDKASVHIDKAIALDPSCNISLLEYARRFSASKKYIKAEQVLNRFLESKPQPPVPLRAYAFRKIAKLKDKQGLHQEAEKLKKQAHQLDPVNVPSIRWLPVEDLLTAP